jgi:hypothetical protein
VKPSFVTPWEGQWLDNCLACLEDVNATGGTLAMEAPTMPSTAPRRIPIERRLRTCQSDEWHQATTMAMPTRTHKSNDHRNTLNQTSSQQQKQQVK